MTSITGAEYMAVIRLTGYRPAIGIMAGFAYRTGIAVILIEMMAV